MPLGAFSSANRAHCVINMVFMVLCDAKKVGRRAALPLFPTNLTSWLNRGDPDGVQLFGI
jgi:hypothetical protein